MCGTCVSGRVLWVGGGHYPAPGHHIQDNPLNGATTPSTIFVSITQEDLGPFVTRIWGIFFIRMWLPDICVTIGCWTRLTYIWACNIPVAQISFSLPLNWANNILHNSLVSLFLNVAWQDSWKHDIYRQTWKKRKVFRQQICIFKFPPRWNSKSKPFFWIFPLAPLGC